MSNINNLSNQQERELIAIKAASSGFPEYCVAIDDQYRLEWFHNIISLKLEQSVKRVENGEDVRIMIFMPPRHGKSDNATQKFPAWVLGNHPDWPFIVSSYSQELATDFGQGTRDIMDSPNYKAIFNTRLREDTTAKAKWMTEEGGGYTAVGVGGAITGRGFKIGIIDDPFKNREEADSPVVRENVHKWYRSTFYTRQEGNTAIILILTRWHDDDLAGRLLKEEREAIENGETDYDKWEVLEFKAIAEEDEEFRKEGDALWPDKFSKPKLLKTKSAIGSYEFSALYQQNPIDEENQEFKKEWIRYRKWEDIKDTPVRRFATIDPAGSKKKKSDFTGVTRNYVNSSNEWNIKSRRYRLNSRGIIDLIFTLHDEGMEVIGIEEGVYSEAIEPFLKEEMEKRGIYPNIVPLKHGGTMKETRIRGLIPRYEYAKVYHITENGVNTCKDLEEEYLRFPKSAHDDCLDTTAYQNQIAQPPSSGIGDRISYEEISKNLSSRINDQSEPVIIGISSTIPIHYVIGNKSGLFFNKVCSHDTDLFNEISQLIQRWGKCFVFSDEIGNVIGLKKLQAQYPGKVYICWLNNDSKTQNIKKWGNKDKYGEVSINKDSAIQLLIDEIMDKRFTLNGSKEDWNDFITQFTNLFRVWDIDSSGNKTYSWQSSSPFRFVNASLYFRVGLDRYGESKATIIGNDMFDGVPMGRIFKQ